MSTPWQRLGGVVLVGVMLLTGCGGSTEGKFGQELYEQTCSGCHAADGSGGTGKPLGPGSGAVDLTDDQIASVIRVGPGSMPSYDRLTDEQVESLVDYIRELQEP